MEISTSLKVKADLENLSSIRSFVEEAAEKIELSEVSKLKIRLAVDEACANIMLHGYRSAEGEIDISIKSEGAKMIVTLSDTAPHYNPLCNASAPDLDAPLCERAIGGMGVLIIKQNTDAVTYETIKGGGNRLILTKS